MTDTIEALWKTGCPLWFWVGRFFLTSEHRPFRLAYPSLREACDAAYCRHLTS